MSLITHLSDLVGTAFADIGLPNELGKVVPSSRPELGQFQCNGAMQAAKLASRPPRDIAGEIVGALSDQPEIAALDIAGPGFINITVTDTSLARWARSAAADEHLGFDVRSQPQTVVVDYAGPNVAKAMHVGHLRATIIGDSLARVFRFAGHNVIRDPHFGDWGFQMGLLLVAIEDEGLDPSAISLDDLQRIYPEASNRAREDGAFADRARAATVALQQGNESHLATWKQMKAVSEASQRADFSVLGVEFDLWFGESDVHDRIPNMVDGMKASGAAELSEGALVVFVNEEEDNRDIPPLILESSAGGFLYSTTDLATIDFRHRELGADICLYVVDRRQSDHFLQLFRSAYKAGIAPSEMALEHIGFGTMNGPDGKPFKTREGGVVRLGDVIEMITEAARDRLDEAQLADEYSVDERDRIASQVGVAALKFGDLINNRLSDYIFDLDRFSSFEGKTGPYLQYTGVRIKSILRKAANRGLEPARLIEPAAPSERDLWLKLLELPEVVERTIELRAPNHVAEYAFEVAGQFNRFYDDCHILSEEDAARQASWLAVARWTLRSLERLLDLLGIEIPDRM